MTKKEQREAEILCAACRVFRREGFHRTRMADIAREADVSYGLVYHYFKNKDELFDAVLAGWWDGLDEMLDRGMADAKNAEDRLRTVIGYFLDQYEKNPDLVHLFITEVSRSTVNLTPVRLNAFRALIVRTEQIIAQAQADGELRSDIKARYLSTFFLGALETMVSTLVLNNQPLKGNRLKKRITENLLSQFFDGARPAAP